jgi:hypothetical protein
MLCIPAPSRAIPWVRFQPDAEVLTLLTMLLDRLQSREHSPKIAAEHRLGDWVMAVIDAPIAIAAVQNVDHHCVLGSLVAAITHECAHGAHQILELRDGFRR